MTKQNCIEVGDAGGYLWTQAHRNTIVTPACFYPKVYAILGPVYPPLSVGQGACCTTSVNEPLPHGAGVDSSDHRDATGLPWLHDSRHASTARLMSLCTSSMDWSALMICEPPSSLLVGVRCSSIHSKGWWRGWGVVRV